jgi:hypothetical protein
MTDAEISYRVRHRVTNPADFSNNKPKHGSVSHFVYLLVYLRLSAGLMLVKNNYVRWQKNGSVSFASTNILQYLQIAIYSYFIL